MTGGRVRDAGGGDNREDPSGAFRSGQADQGDLPRAEGLSEGSPEGAAVGSDLVRVRARGPAAAEDRSLEGGSGSDPRGECRQAGPRAPDADADLRGAARARLSRRLRRRSPLRPWLAARAGVDGGRYLCAAELRAG